MLQDPGHYIGDAWYYVAGDVVHAFYLVCPESVPPHTRWDIGHATSRDLVNWELHSLALTHGDAGTWSECLATGSIFRRNGRYGMAFTSHTRAETGIAWSDDLFAWSVDPALPVTSVDLRYYEANGTGKRTFPHWRDPFAFEHDQSWYQLVCATNPKAPLGARGCVGVVRYSDDRWEALPPLNVAPYCQEMECPQIVVRGGFFYLLFSTMKDFIAEPYRSREFERGLPWGGTFFMMSENLFGTYRVTDTPLILPPGLPQAPYACQWVGFHGKDYLLGTIWEEGSLSYIDNPYPIEFTESGVHCLQSGR
jgi:beta-fructofuranosidase